MKYLCALLVLLVASACAAYAQTPACESLSTLSLPQAKILAAESIPAGTFKSPVELPPWQTGIQELFKSLPAFCRVVLQAAPSSDSDIRIEVWLPAKEWNLKFQAHGNGGFAGDIDYYGLATSIRGNYATANTNTGHTGESTDASWALHHPEKVIDFGYRGVHLMTVLAKEVIRAYYKSAPLASYFLGCSNGGRQALMEAQRFPGDYNGILAGAPANYWTHLLSAGLWNSQALASTPDSYIPASKIPAITQAVNSACDAADGVTDGVVSDPRKCGFDPQIMLCKGPDSNSCLLQPQIVALKKLYEGPHTPDGAKIFPGLQPGAEDGPNGWIPWIVGSQKGTGLMTVFTRNYFANMVYGDPGWDYEKADFAESLKLADQKTAKILNATDPDLEPFRARGGKLILYHGWNDPAISAVNSIDYFESVRARLGSGKTDSFLRFYLLPGVQHCGSGPGADEFGADSTRPILVLQKGTLSALESWVEGGAAPQTLPAAKLSGAPPSASIQFTRPLCPYPQSAKYKGSGDPNSASSFTCAAPH